jgi:hypothetical protein
LDEVRKLIPSLSEESLSSSKSDAKELFLLILIRIYTIMCYKYKRL